MNNLKRQDWNQLNQLSSLWNENILNQRILDVYASNLSKRKDEVKQIEKALDNVWLTDDYTFKKLKEQILAAKTVAPNGAIIPDFLEMVKAIKIRKLLRWYTKKWLSLDELLGLDTDKETRKIHVHKVLDDIGLTDEVVFKQLKYIIDEAYIVIPLKWNDFTIAPYNKVINMAIREYSLLKDYIEDDTFNALSLLKVDEKKLQIIFGDNLSD